MKKILRATSHTRLTARHQYTSSTLDDGKDGARPIPLHTTLLEGPTKHLYISECKMMDVKVYMDSYMASNVSCFMITWTILKNHLLEVGLT